MNPMRPIASHTRTTARALCFGLWLAAAVLAGGEPPTDEPGSRSLLGMSEEPLAGRAVDAPGPAGEDLTMKRALDRAGEPRQARGAVSRMGPEAQDELDRLAGALEAERPGALEDFREGFTRERLAQRMDEHVGPGRVAASPRWIDVLGNADRAAVTGEAIILMLPEASLPKPTAAPSAEERVLLTRMRTQKSDLTSRLEGLARLGRR